MFVCVIDEFQQTLISSVASINHLEIDDDHFRVQSFTVGMFCVLHLLFVHLEFTPHLETTYIALFLYVLFVCICKGSYYPSPRKKWLFVQLNWFRFSIIGQFIVVCFLVYSINTGFFRTPFKLSFQLEATGVLDEAATAPLPGFVIFIILITPIIVYLLSIIKVYPSIHWSRIWYGLRFYIIEMDYKKLTSASAKPKNPPPGKAVTDPIT